MLQIIYMIATTLLAIYGSIQLIERIVERTKRKNELTKAALKKEFDKTTKKGISSISKVELDIEQKKIIVYSVIEKNIPIGPKEIDQLDNLDSNTIREIKYRLSNFSCASYQFKALVRILCKNVILPELPPSAT